MKDLHGLWEGAWADGSFFSLKWGGIWVVLDEKKVKIVIVSRDTGFWHHPKEVLDLQQKQEDYDCLLKRFFSVDFFGYII